MKDSSDPDTSERQRLRRIYQIAALRELGYTDAEIEAATKQPPAPATEPQQAATSPEEDRS